LTSRGRTGGWSPRATGPQPTLSQTAACGESVWGRGRWCPQAALVTAQNSGPRMRRAHAPTGRRGRECAAGRQWTCLARFACFVSHAPPLPCAYPRCRRFERALRFHLDCPGVLMRESSSSEQINAAWRTLPRVGLRVPP
jgi:hypothetical protein